MMEFELSQIATPLIVLLGLAGFITLLYLMSKSKDGGKGIIESIQKNKIAYTEVSLVAFAIAESIVAANTHGGNAAQFSIRLMIHLLIGFVGAYIGFIVMRELGDAYKKTMYEDHNGIYIFVKWVQVFLAAVLSFIIPFFNLLIIASGLEQIYILFGEEVIDGVAYSLSWAERFQEAETTLVSSFVMVLLHVSLPVLVGLWAFDDIKKPEPKKEKGKEEKKKKDEKTSDSKSETEDEEKEEDVPKPTWKEAATSMGRALGVSAVNINNALGKVKDDSERAEMKRKLVEYGWYFDKNKAKMIGARTSLDKFKKKGNKEKVAALEREINKINSASKQTSDNFNRLWDNIQDASN